MPCKFDVRISLALSDPCLLDSCARLADHGAQACRLATRERRRTHNTADYLNCAYRPRSPLADASFSYDTHRCGGSRRLPEVDQPRPLATDSVSRGLGPSTMRTLT